MRHPLTILFGYVFMFLFGMCVNPFIHYPRKHFDCLIAIVVHIAIGAALLIYGGWPALLLTLVIPFFITYAVATYFFYAQHNFPGVSFSDQGGWTYEKAAMESSSFMRTGRIMGWFTANISYHHIHHLNARVPFYRLPEAMQANPGASESQDHVPASGRHSAVPEAEGLGRRCSAHGGRRQPIRRRPQGTRLNSNGTKLPQLEPRPRRRPSNP